MDEFDGLAARAADIIGGDETVVAAGVFGRLDRDAETVAALAGAAGAIAAIDNPVGVRAGASQPDAGPATTTFTPEDAKPAPRVLVAVTPSTIHVLEWTEGTGPTRMLADFDRSTTSVRSPRFGLTRRLTLDDVATRQSVDLTGAAMFFTPSGRSDRLVRRALKRTG